MANMLKPQKGPQERFLSTPADICIYGGAAGGGKTFGLLLSPLRYKNVPGFGAVIFRDSLTQIFSEGGLWDESVKMYGPIKGATLKKSPPQWQFRNSEGALMSKVTFSYLGGDDAGLGRWQGSQICEICFDELTHFTEKQFFYMLSRNRSTCGVKPFVRATCNPDADSWVAKFIEWWIDQDTGYPIPERSGKIRWMARFDNHIYWGNTKEELYEQNENISEADPKSVSFIMSSVFDNQALLDVDPSYLSNLKALPLIERERLLRGNWKIKAAAGLFFKRSQVGNFLDVIPADVVKWVRCWDLAATAESEGGQPACTAGVLIGKRRNGRYIIADVINVKQTAYDVRKTIRLTAQQDVAKFKRVTIRIPQDPGQAGKAQAQAYIKFLAGFNIKAVGESGSKEARAEPLAAQWQAGNVDIYVADWNDEYLTQMENFPEGKLKDMVDATANGFSEIERDALNLDSEAFLPLDMVEENLRCENTTFGRNEAGQTVLLKPVKRIEIAASVAHFADDMTCIAYIVNESCKIYKKKQGHDSPSTASDIAALAMRLAKTYRFAGTIPVKIDSGSNGCEVIERLEEIVRDDRDKYGQISVAPIPFGRHIKNAYYEDSTTYMMAELRRLINTVDELGRQKEPELILPDDSELIEQLEDRQYEYTRDNKQRIETRIAYRDRHNGRSPDESDCILLFTVQINTDEDAEE